MSIPPMKRGKRPLPPSGGLIALGTSSKRDSIDENRKRDTALESSSKHAKQARPSRADLAPADLASQLMSLTGDVPALVPKLVEAWKLLSNCRANPPESLFTAILFVFKEADGHSLLVEHPDLMKVICGILKEQPSSGAKQRPSNAVVGLSSSVLLQSYKDVDVWPLNFIRLFAEDYTGERIWTESSTNGLCAEFVSSVTSAFGTSLPPNFSDSATKPKLFLSTASFKDEKNSPLGSPAPMIQDQPNRYQGLSVEIGKIIVEVANDVLAKKPLPDVALKNLLNLLCISSGVVQVRVFASSKLDVWLHSTKLLKQAQDLFSSVCINCAESDNDVLANLVRIKPKTKIASQFISQSLKDMAVSNPRISDSLVKNLVFNEFSGINRNPNNMNLLMHLFQNDIEQTSKNLAYAFQIVLYQKDDYTKAVRTFFREIMKSQRHEVRVKSFCRALLDIQDDVSGSFDQEKLPVGKYYAYLIDIVTYSLLLSVPPACREMYTSRMKRDEKDLQMLRNTQGMFSELMCELLEWLKSNTAHLHKEHFCPLIQRILYFDPIDSYFRQDPWPSDQNVCYLIATEAISLEATLSNLIFFGLDPGFPLSPPDALNFIEFLVTRSLAGSVKISKEKELFTGLFNLAVYTKPASIVLPASYEPPQLAVSALLWKVWLILTVLTGSNTGTVAKLGWDHYPTLKTFMEMALTSDFTFPPSTSQLNRESLRLHEIQTKEREKQEIINFECHLAGKTITAETSILANQLVFIEPLGLPRQPPNDFLVRLKNICTSLKIGSALCSSRENDYLLDILQRNQSLSGMAWLSQIILTSDIKNLPSQCLCEYMLSTRDSSALDRCDKLESIKIHLRALILTSESSSDVFQILRYFFTAMCSCENFFKRKAASRALTTLLSDTDEVQTDAIFQVVSQLDCFEEFSTEITAFALQTFSFEFDLPLLVSSFFYLISQIPLELSDRKTNVILFSETFCKRPDVVKRILGQYPDLKCMLPEFCDYIVSCFEASIQKTVPDDWIEISSSTGKMRAPKDVFSCCFGLNIISTGNGSSKLPLTWLKLDLLESILPGWMIDDVIALDSDVCISWINAAKNPTELLRFCSCFGLSEQLKAKVATKMESFSLAEIKDSLHKYSKHPSLIAPSELGARFECAHQSIFPGSSSSEAVVVTEIDEMEVDSGQAEKSPSLSAANCKSDTDWVNFIQEGMSVGYEGLSRDLLKYCDDSTVAMTSLVTVMQDSFGIFDCWASEHESELNSLLMKIARNLGFNWLCKFHRELEKVLSAKRYSKCLKFTQKMIDDEEVRMQPKSPEPEVKISLKAKSLLDAGASRTAPISGRQISTTGKILDLLKTSDPEIVKKHSDYLWKILFSSEHKLSAYHCYLLSLLVHNSNWETLSGCVHTILEGPGKDESVRMNPTTALDFLTALLKQPRLFQGRDSALVRKSSTAVMKLELSDLLKLIDIIAEEGRGVEGGSDEQIEKLQARVVLLLKFAHSPDVKIIQEIMQYCKNIKEESLSRTLSLLVYLNTAVPVPENCDIGGSVAGREIENSFPNDCLLHGIMIPISSPGCSKESFQLASCIVLKFASMHPVFMDRQIELVSILLQGRGRTSWGAFKREGHADLFRLALKILDRLSPDIFSNPRFPDIMKIILEVYSTFASLTNDLFRESRKLLFDLIDKLFEHDCSLTVEILQPHVAFIANYPGIDKHLLNSLHISDSDLQSGSQSAPLAPSPQVVANELSRIRRFLVDSKDPESTEEEALEIIKSVEELCHKRVNELETLVEPIGMLLTASSSHIVDRTISVLLSICRFIPSASSEICRVFLFALRKKSNRNVSRILEAVNLDHLLSCCSDNGLELLSALFDASVELQLPFDEKLKSLVSGQTLENILRQDKS